MLGGCSLATCIMNHGFWSIFVGGCNRVAGPCCSTGHSGRRGRSSDDLLVFNSSVRIVSWSFPLVTWSLGLLVSWWFLVFSYWFSWWPPVGLLIVASSAGVSWWGRTSVVLGMACWYSVAHTHGRFSDSWSQQFKPDWMFPRTNSEGCWSFQPSKRVFSNTKGGTRNANFNLAPGRLGLPTSCFRDKRSTLSASPSSSASPAMQFLQLSLQLHSR